MKGLDTNVLVRYLVRDDIRQAAVADREIQACAAAGEKMVLQPVVLCELIWVLESAYGYSKQELLPILERILRTSQFEIVQRDVVWRALAEYGTSKGDFSDYLISEANHEAGAMETLTFDRALKSSGRFRVV